MKTNQIAIFLDRPVHAWILKYRDGNVSLDMNSTLACVRSCSAIVIFNLASLMAVLAAFCAFLACSRSSIIRFALANVSSALSLKCHVYLWNVLNMLGQKNFSHSLPKWPCNHLSFDATDKQKVNLLIIVSAHIYLFWKNLLQKVDINSAFCTPLAKLIRGFVQCTMYLYKKYGRMANCS